MTTQPQTDTPTPGQQPFVVPDGITLEHRIGPVTGRPLYKVAGFEMPYETTAEGAVKLYERLKQAYESGYFAGLVRK